MMKSFVSLLLVAATVSGAAIPEEDGVLVLNDANFDQAISDNNFILVEFYAPWCGHCKKLTPEWASAAKTLAGSEVKLAKVDATEAKELAEKFAIKGFPTIKMFKHGSAGEYNGGRTAAEIVAYAKKASGPAATTLTTVQELADFQEAHEVFALGFFADASSAAAKGFVGVAAGDDDNTFAISSSDAVKAALGVTADTVSVFKAGEAREDLTVTSFNKETVSTFIAGSVMPLINEFTPEASKKIFGNAIKKHALFFTKKGSDHVTPTKAVFKEVASQFKGNMLVIHVSSSEQKVLEFFGLKTEDLPALAFADLTDGMKKFAYSGSFDASSISGHAAKFLSGSLKPTLKAEPAHPDDLTGPVKIAKAGNFQELVLDSPNDVLIEFYAPWCGHCKSLAPTWDELGKTFADVPSVTIAKCDATANEFDVKGMNVKGFPTIYFFKGGDKANPVKYESGRELEDFISYLEKNAATKFSITHGDHTHGNEDVHGSDEL